MLLRLLCLIMVGVHLSTQDLVTLAPSDGPEKVTETAPTPSELEHQVHQVTASYPSYRLGSIPAPPGAGSIVSAECESGPPGADKVYLNDINWLQPLLTNQTSTVTIEGKEYHLGLNQTDTSFGDCKVGSEVGECHHIEYCALDIFIDKISDFIPYQCSIPGDYLAVCCPKNNLSQVL